MKLVLTDQYHDTSRLYPFTLIRKIACLRVGILTISEKWKKYSGLGVIEHKEGNYKDSNNAISLEDCGLSGEGFLLVNSCILPDEPLLTQLNTLLPGEALYWNDVFIGGIVNDVFISDNTFIPVTKIQYLHTVNAIFFPWDIIQRNAEEIKNDCILLSDHCTTLQASQSIKITGNHPVYIAENTVIESAIFNTADGPVYIGKNALIMDGAILRGPVAIGDYSVVKIGAKIYGGTSTGPWCTLGGEVKNSILLGYSNKAHEGYMGDSLIGEWCNWGAGSSNSNIKNNAGNIVIEMAGQQHAIGLKCGVLMGDYSRAAINSAINTATIMGICVNYFSTGLSAKNIPSFTWDASTRERYREEKALEHINAWMLLKGKELSEAETKIIQYIYTHLK